MTTKTSVTDAEIVRLLQNGAIGILPTDTVYGIVARAADSGAVARLYAAKHREGKPGTIIAASIDQLISLGLQAMHLPEAARLWPGPLSIVLPDNPELAYLDQGKQSLAVRVPADKAIHELLLQTGPLLTSSANMPGEPTATTLDEARAYFGDTVDFYVDGGSIEQSIASTLIRVSEAGAVEVLRPGPIKVN
ncbi:MAG TPA: L-threonylcarbamoyladenylate synthase [Candidatus Saccharimonadales bacterium]